MRIWKLLLAGVMISGCTAENRDSIASETGGPERPRLLALSDMEAAAPGAPQRAKQERDAADLERRAKRAMEMVLFDPFSARFRNLRAGREGAVCGQVNAKNRLGAYVGFRDFVAGRSGDAVMISSYSDGIRSTPYGSFTDAYLAACASRAESNRHYAVIGRPYATTTNTTVTTGYEPYYEPPTASDDAAADFSAAEGGYEDEGDYD